MDMQNLDDVFDDNLEFTDVVSDEPLETDVRSEVVSDNDDSIFFDDSPTNQTNNPNNSLIDDLLKARGIDSGKLIIINDNDEEEQVDFYSLSKEDQLDILNQQEESNYDLGTSEIDLINHLRTNNLTVEQFLESYKQTILSENTSSEVTTYDIDAYDDEELYMLDLQNKYDLTDEELEKELAKELQDEILFKKKVDKLRIEYKTLEDQSKENQRLEFEQKQQEEYGQFTQQMVDIAVNTPEFYGIELEDNEKNEVLSFLLELDQDGVSEFSKTLNSPKKLYEAAWFLRYGKESFDMLKNAYESEIAKLKTKDKKPGVIKRTDTSQKNSIHDLF